MGQPVLELEPIKYREEEINTGIGFWILIEPVIGYRYIYIDKSRISLRFYTVYSSGVMEFCPLRK